MLRYIYYKGDLQYGTKYKMKLFSIISISQCLVCKKKHVKRNYTKIVSLHLPTICVPKIPKRMAMFQSHSVHLGDSGYQELQFMMSLKNSCCVP